MSQSPPDVAMSDVDNLTLTTFINKFNEKYSNDLLEEQKELFVFEVSL